MITLGEMVKEYQIMDVDGTYIQIELGESQEAIKKEVKKREKILYPISDEDRSDRDITMRGNLFSRLEKANTNLEVLRIINTAVKFSQDDMFEYRRFVDLLKELGYNIIPKPDKDLNNIDNIDLFTQFIVGQTIYSIEEYGVIHPKLKLLISIANKTIRDEDDRIKAELEREKLEAEELEKSLDGEETEEIA